MRVLNPTLAPYGVVFFFGCTGLVIFFTARGHRDGSLEARRDRHQIVFRSRPETVIAKAIGFLLVPVLSLTLMAFGGPELRPILGLIFVFSLAQLAFFAGRMPGPKRLEIDLDRRTYRYRGGTLLRPNERAGAWDDLADVYVRRLSGNRGYNGYQVFVAWRDGNPDQPMLGMFGRSADADRLAAEVAETLGLRVADAPTAVR